MASNLKFNQSCLFCKIIKGEIPSFKLLETEKSYAFLDTKPLARGHSLVIPKHHEVKLHDVPDEYLVDILPTAKAIAVAAGFENYNILQNNGEIAHQRVDHVHFHVIPKSDQHGLVVGWPDETVQDKTTEQEELQKVYEEIKGRLSERV